MIKDIAILTTTRDRKTFEEQAKFWPGVEVFAKYTWNCVCTDPDCLMNCIQSIGRWFPSHLVFAQFLEDAANCTSDEELKDKMDDYATKHPFFRQNLEAALERQIEEGNGVSQRTKADRRTIH